MTWRMFWFWTSADQSLTTLSASRMRAGSVIMEFQKPTDA
jgi:hypothetical protein